LQTYSQSGALHTASSGPGTAQCWGFGGSLLSGWAGPGSQDPSHHPSQGAEQHQAPPWEHRLTRPPATFRKLPKGFVGSAFTFPYSPSVPKWLGLSSTAISQAGKCCVLGNTAGNPLDERRRGGKRCSADFTIKSCFLSIFMQLNH